MSRRTIPRSQGEIEEEEPGADSLGSSPLIGGGMSYQATGWVIEFSKSTLGARLVLLTLSYHMNNETGICFPSLDTIAKECRMTKAGVIQAMERLEESGELEVERTEGGSGNVNRYRMPLFASWWEIARKIDPQKGKKGKPYYEKGKAETEETVNPIREKGIQGLPEQKREQERLEQEIEQEPSTLVRDDPKQVFRQCKRYYRGFTGKTPGNVPPSRGEEWIRLVDDKTGDKVFEAFQLWVQDIGKDRLRGFRWPMAVFLKNIDEQIEAVEDKRNGERNEETEEEEARLPKLQPRVGE
jgi:Helix-turn-helix domain